MAYADLAEVAARGGGALSGIDSTSVPTDAQVAGWLDQSSAKVDGFLGARGYPVPVTGSPATSLTGLIADEALILSLGARYPAGGRGVDPLLRDAKERVKAEWEALRDGTHPVLEALEGTGEGASSGGATSFWSEEGDTYTPDPNQQWPTRRLAGPNPYTTPGVHSGLIQ